jgi:hypothetical protein
MALLAYSNFQAWLSSENLEGKPSVVGMKRVRSLPAVRA